MVRDAEAFDHAWHIAMQQEELFKLGRAGYQRYCVGCHGVDGDGAGPAAEFLDPKPRDFRRGVYKFRTTPSGSLPTDEDIYRTITRGVHGTSMPSWVLLPEKTRLGIVMYVKSFSPDFADSDAYAPPVAIPYPPKDLTSAANVEGGRAVYEQMRCTACHGDQGRGDGPSSPHLTDDWGQPITPFDFTSGPLKGGSGVRDIYRTFTTGLNGTPMPAYQLSLSEEQRWQLVAYILSLRQSGTRTE